MLKKTEDFNKADYKLSDKEETELITNINKSLDLYERLIKSHSSQEMLIIRGSNICELMINLILKKEGFVINDYEYFGKIISLALQNQIIPVECGNFLNEIRRYRNETAHSNIQITSDLLFNFLNAFNNFIQWFDNFYSNKYRNTELNTYLCSNIITKLKKVQSNDYSIEDEIDNPMINQSITLETLQGIESELDNFEKAFDTNSKYIKKIENELLYKKQLQIKEIKIISLQNKIKNLEIKLKEKEEEIIELKRQKELQPSYLESMGIYAKSFGDTLDNILNIVNNIEQKTDIIDYKVDNIDKKLDSIKTQISQFQRDAEKHMENAASEEEIEKIIDKFINRCVENIVNQMEHLINNQYYENEKSNLIKSLGNDAWDKLSEKSKTFLITSKVMYKKLSKTDSTIDYSGICILVTKALEVEMKKRFFTYFIKYLCNKYNKDYSKYHTALIYKNKTVLLSEKFTMGSIAYALCYNNSKFDTKDQKLNNKIKLMEYCKSCIFSQQTDTEINNLLKEYAISIEDIKETYRNPSAHTNEIRKIDAEECFNLLIDVEKLLKKMLDSFDF